MTASKFCKTFSFINGKPFDLYCARSCNSCAFITTTTTTTTKSTTQANSLNCVNDNDSLCNYFGFGYCSSASTYVSGKKFAQFCKKLCQDPTCLVQATCVDSTPSCSFWTNYCYLLAGQDPHPCRATCKLC